MFRLLPQICISADGKNVTFWWQKDQMSALDKLTGVSFKLQTL